MSYMNFNQALRNFKFTIVMRRQHKRIQGVINAPTDQAARDYIEGFGFNDKNSIIAITATA